MVPKEPQSKVPYFDPQIPLLRVGVEGRKFLCVARTSDPCRLTLLGQLPELVAFRAILHTRRTPTSPQTYVQRGIGLLLLQLQIPMLQGQDSSLPAMEPTRPTHKGGVTVLRQLEAARVYVPPCLLSEFASQYSDPFLCAGNRKNRNTGNRNWALWPFCTGNGNGGATARGTARGNTKFGAKTGTGYGIEGALALLDRKRKWWHHLTSCTT